MLEDYEDQENKLNKKDLQINRGFEIMMRNTNKKEEVTSEPKTFSIKFGKMLSLLKREIHFNLELSLDFKKVTL